MANATVSRLGQVNGAGDPLALFLKVFANEVLAAFQTANVMFNGNDNAPMHSVRTIDSGKTASFPAHWRAAAEYHTPGVEIVGANLPKNERLINIDALLISHVFLAVIDELMNHYDVRADYSFQLGQALARQADKNVLQAVVLAARAGATVTGGFGGTQLTNAGYDTTPDTLAQGIYDAAQALTEKDVPDDGNRFCVLRPRHYNLLVQSSKAIHRDWTGGTNGSYAKGNVFEIDNVKIIKSNHVPQSVISATTGENNTYSGDFSNTIGPVFHKTAVGTVKLKDLSLESEYDIRRQGTLFVAKYAMGSTTHSA